MEILLLAPHPFYSERGSPIAVAKLLEVLSQRGERVDVLTYNGGEDVDLEHVTIFRTADIPGLRMVRPGFSWKKIVADLLMMVEAVRMIRRKKYDFVHAVEEAAYIALLIKAFFKIPYVYDMDSSLAEQMVEQIPLLEVVEPILRFFERIAVRHAAAVLPVCPTLAREIKPYARGRVMVLHDFSLLRENGPVDLTDIAELNGNGHSLMMYVGNLQRYQGIDLLLKSLAVAVKKSPELSLVIIGGGLVKIRKYRSMAEGLGIGSNVHLLGPKPLDHLSAYLDQADVVVSPRTKGSATPMKIYSYLDTGKPMLATRLPTHTQIVGPEEAMLADPNPDAFGKAMLRLAGDRKLRIRIGRNGKRLVNRQFPYSAFLATVNEIFNWIGVEIVAEGRIRSTQAASERL